MYGVLVDENKLRMIWTMNYGVYLGGAVTAGSWFIVRLFITESTTIRQTD